MSAPAEAGGCPAGPPVARSLIGRFARIDGWRRAVLTWLAGGASVLAMPPVFLWPILFITFPMLVWLLDGCFEHPLKERLKRAAMTGWWFGFGYFLFGLYWIAEAFLVEAGRHAWLLPFALFGLPAALALFFALAAAAAMLIWSAGIARIFALALALGMTEWARGHVLTGFPWNVIGHALTATEPMMQAASLTGVNALTVFAVVLFASPAAIFTPFAGRRPMLAGVLLTGAALLLLFGGVMFGERRLAAASTAMVEGVRFRIVQANISQRDKWAPENAAEILATYLALSRGTSPTVAARGVTHIVWPETALPVLLADEPEVRSAVADLLPEGAFLIAGSARLEQDAGPNGGIAAERVYNSLFVLNAAATVVGSYDKMHLVPFGEYLPAQNFMESIGIFQLTGVRGGFTPGTGPRVLLVPEAPPAAPLICYEIIFPDAVTDPTIRPGWLLNLTNDAWFGASAGPYQHFHQARLRAVEQGVPVVRSANTGVSAVIDPYGRIVASLGLNRSGVVEAELPEALPPTPYAIHGARLDAAAFALAALLAALTHGSATLWRAGRTWQ